MKTAASSVPKPSVSSPITLSVRFIIQDFWVVRLVEQKSEEELMRTRFFSTKEEAVVAAEHLARYFRVPVVVEEA